MKSPLPRRVAPAAVVAALLVAPTACGFNAQTDQQYQPAEGIIDRSGAVDILDALVVADEDGNGALVATLANDTKQDDALQSVTGSGIEGSSGTIPVPAEGVADLTKQGPVAVKGPDVKPGKFVELTLEFRSGQSTTLKVPVVAATGVYADVPLPSESPTESPSPTGKHKGSSPSASPSGSPSGSPSASPTE